MTIQSFEIRHVGAFDLRSYSSAAGGALMMHVPSASVDGLNLAFLADDFENAVAVRVYQLDGMVHGELCAGDADIDLVRGQVARMLALDCDATDFDLLAGRESIVSMLQRRYPGLRHYAFSSPYESAVRFVIGQRMQMRQAAVIRQRLSEVHGGRVTAGNTSICVVPTPLKLLSIQEFEGLNQAKVKALHAVARAALDGALDAQWLRALPHEFALQQLQTIHGIGPFSAEGILIRGVVSQDALPGTESRLRRAVACAYGLANEPDDRELIAIAEHWRPYRGWVSYQLRRWQEEESHGR